jgi:hypothetical protein
MLAVIPLAMVRVIAANEKPGGEVQDDHQLG